MSLTYSKLYELIKKMPTVKNPCLICHQDNESSIILPCSHEYHKYCISEYMTNLKKTQLKCPYCLKSISQLRYGSIVNGIQSQIITKKKPTTPNGCTAIIKSGKNKGNQCDKRCKTNTFCGMHSKSV
jgi:hypothetical protein